MCFDINLKHTKETYSSHKDFYNCSLKPLAFTFWVESIWLSTCQFFLFFNAEWEQSYFFLWLAQNVLVNRYIQWYNRMIWNTLNESLPIYCILNLWKYFPRNNVKIEDLHLFLMLIGGDKRIRRLFPEFTPWYYPEMQHIAVYLFSF